MTVVDLLLALLLVLAGVAGGRRGLVVRAAGLVGLVAGVALSVRTIPLVLDLAGPPSPRGRLVVVLVTFLVTVLVTSGLAEVVGLRVRAAVDETRLSGLDRAGGAVAGVAGVLLGVWLLAPLASAVPGDVSRAVRGSVVVAVVAELAPDPPDPLTAVRSFVADSPFPEVFADLAPAPSTGPPPGRVPIDADVLATVAASTVKVEVAGCGVGSSGSGWAAATDLVVTNAHVVAGADAVQVRRPDGTRADATVVAFDPGSDLALLRVPDLGQAPLPLGTADPGEDAATLGHPGGRDELRIAPARVERTILAAGRDVYGRSLVEREVVVLAASLARGDSGSPAVDTTGSVVGVVFAISPDDPDTAYALSTDEVRDLLAAPRRPGDAGTCT